MHQMPFRFCKHSRRWRSQSRAVVGKAPMASFPLTAGPPAVESQVIYSHSGKRRLELNDCSRLSVGNGIVEFGEFCDEGPKPTWCLQRLRRC